MIFDDQTEEFFYQQQSAFDSPDLRPIPLSMSGYDKSLEGMINLQSAGAAFPNSNAFQYLQSMYAPDMTHQHAVSNNCRELEVECPSDSEFGYSFDYPDQESLSTLKHEDISGRSQAQQSWRKRKASASPEYVQPQPQKRAAVAHLNVQSPSGDCYDLKAQTSPYAATFAAATPGGAVHFAGSQVAGNSPRPGHSHSTSNVSQISLAAPSPMTPAFSPSFTTVKTEHSPRAPMTPAPRPASAASTLQAAIPKLVRTSTIPQQASPNLGPVVHTGLSTHNFNPYAMYPHNKATLRLNGDLDGVATKWSADELEVNRKLVVFTRSQTGSVIDAEFKVVAPQDWQRSDITVNCIWWKDRNEAFVTSVDTIALLEALVAVRFTVEEKNRIRRNLEGFRPLTVSKAKADSEDFFKVIMGFPNPKPRNIEKDVKVFPWKILAHALKKIIGKYSASYSSTASAMVTPIPSGYVGAEGAVNYPYAASPEHELLQHGMQAQHLALSYDNRMVTSQMTMPMATGVAGLSLQVPAMGPYEMMPQSYSYEGTPISTQSMQMTPHPASAPVHPVTQMWEFDQFNRVHPHMVPSSAPASAYPQGHIESADFMIPHMHAMQHQHAPHYY